MPQIVDGKSIDINKGGVRPNYNKYPLNYHNFGTYRFGEYGVHFVFNAIAGDKIKLRSAHEVDSYTLKAPLMTPIQMNKDYIMVPRMAMLPNAWEKLYTNPSIGDDIDATVCGTSVPAENWGYFMYSCWKALYEYSIMTDTTVTLPSIEQNLEGYIYALNLCEYIFSYGSLMASLEEPYATLFQTLDGKNFDTLYEEFWNKLELGRIDIIDRDGDGQGSYCVLLPNAEFSIRDIVRVGYKNLYFHDFLTKVREGMRFTIELMFDTNNELLNTDEDLIPKILPIINNNLLIPNPAGSAIWGGWTKPHDLAREWAYQLTCAEFYTNDKVDYVYNAELFRQLIGNYILGYNGQWSTYTINGIKIEYDYLSAYYFMITGLADEDGYSNIHYNINKEMYSYYCAIFKYNRSLKFVDYFTGARTHVIGVGNTNIPVDVNNRMVEVVNVAANIQKQRFLNIINKIPRKLEEYTKALIGVDVAPDWHNPRYLAHTSDTIGASETQNTAEAQITEEVSRTSTLVSNGAKHEFTIEIDRDSIILGITSFDIERSYYTGIDRHTFHVDRFDWFNQYMQYTGDQEIYGEEYRGNAVDSQFGYQDAYAEFKQRQNRAFGGFVTALKGWTFLNDLAGTNDERAPLYSEHIGPDIIRSKPVEMDRFYTKLTGKSLANYFHFIIDNYNEFEAKRPIAYKPQILG